MGQTQQWVQAAQLVELQVNAQNSQSNQIYFQNLGNVKILQGKRIVGMEFYTSDVVPISPISNNLPCATSTRVRNTFLTMYYEPLSEKNIGQYIDKFPAISLVNVNDNANPYVWDRFAFDRILPQWEKCYLYSPTLFSDEGFNYSFLINIYYLLDPISAMGATNTRLDAIENFLRTKR